MKGSQIICASLFLVLIAVRGGPLAAQSIKGREILGLRIGGLAASGALDAEFGGGSEIELHFIHGITHRFGVDVSLSSHNFGAAVNRNKNLSIFGRSSVNLQIYSLTAGMILLQKVHERTTATVEAGTGLYSVTTSLPYGFYEAQKTDNHMGVYGGIGALVRVADTVLLNANLKYHTMYVGNALDDTVRLYTEESEARFFQISVGIMIATR